MMMMAGELEMVQQEDPELISCHRHKGSTATRGNGLNTASTTRGSTEKGGRGRDAAPARHTPQPQSLLVRRDSSSMPGTPAFNLAHQRGAPTHLALKADRNVPRKTSESP